METIPVQDTDGPTQEKKTGMSIKPGDEVAVTPEALAEEVKGQVWSILDHGVMYDAEFTGRADSQGNLVMKVKKRSAKQPKS